MKLRETSPGDARVYLGIYLLTQPEDPENELARKVLESHRGLDISGHLTLAAKDIGREKWKSAREQVEAALQIDSQNVKAWEMMVEIGRGVGNKALTQASIKALIQRAPHHFLHYQDLGVQAYAKGNLDEAEKWFREGIGYNRKPVLLNNLAHILFEGGDDLEGAHGLVTEALEKEPDNAAFLNTRGAICLRLGRYDEARTDLQRSLQIKGAQPRVLLMLAEVYEGLGDKEHSLKVAVALAKKPEMLSNDERRRLRELITRVR